MALGISLPFRVTMEATDMYREIYGRDGLGAVTKFIWVVLELGKTRTVLRLEKRELAILALKSQH